MILNGMVYANGNVGIVRDGTFSGDYLVEYATIINGVTKSMKQWYNGSVVYDYFISTSERDSYYTAHPTSLIANMICYVKDVGELQYVSSAWIIITVVIPTTDDLDIFDILGERFAGTFTNEINNMSILLNDVNSVETAVFVAEANGVTNVDFSSVVGLNLSTANYSLFFKGLRFTSSQYVINANLHSIDLIGWSLKIGDVVTLEYATKN